MPPRKPFGKNTLGLKFNQMSSLREGLPVSHLKSLLCEYIFKILHSATKWLHVSSAAIDLPSAPHLSPVPKETAQQLCRLFPQNSQLHLHLVVELRMIDHGKH